MPAASLLAGPLDSLFSGWFPGAFSNPREATPFWPAEPLR
jgi:hypothetical protein